MVPATDFHPRSRCLRGAVVVILSLIYLRLRRIRSGVHGDRLFMMIVMLGFTELEVQRAQKLIVDLGPTIAAGTTEEAGKLLARVGPSMVVLALAPSDNLPLVESLLGDNNASSFFVLARSGLEMRSVFRLAKAGLAGIVEMEASRFETQIRDFLIADKLQHWRRIFEDVRITSNPDATLILRDALRLAHKPYQVRDFALTSGYAERTLRRLACRWRIPSLYWLIKASRLLMVTYLVDRGGLRFANAVCELDFESTKYVRAAMCDFLGCDRVHRAGRGYYSKSVDHVQAVLR